jgi:hypothetical protein
MARLLDLVDDPSIAGTQPRVAAGIADELDPRAHANAGPDSSQEVSCTLWIHARSIGCDAGSVIPHSSRLDNPIGQEE